MNNGEIEICNLIDVDEKFEYILMFNIRVAFYGSSSENIPQTVLRVMANLKQRSQTRLKHRINSAKWKFLFLSTKNNDCGVIRGSAQLNYAGLSPTLPTAPRISRVQPTRRELNHDDNSTPQDNKSPGESVYPPLPSQVLQSQCFCMNFILKVYFP